MSRCAGAARVPARRIPQTGSRGYTAPMNPHLSSRLKTLLLALALPLALAACGNKGPLVLPDRPAADAPAEAMPEPAPAPAEAPADAAAPGAAGDAQPPPPLGD